MSTRTSLSGAAELGAADRRRGPACRLGGGGYAAWLNNDDFGDARLRAQPGKLAGIIARTAAGRGEEPSTRHAPAGCRKFTQRLNTDGSEVDQAPAGGIASLGEGTSVARRTPEPTPPPAQPTGRAGTADPAAQCRRCPTARPVPPEASNARRGTSSCGDAAARHAAGCRSAEAAPPPVPAAGDHRSAGAPRRRRGRHAPRAPPAPAAAPRRGAGDGAGRGRPEGDLLRGAHQRCRRFGRNRARSSGRWSRNRRATTSRRNRPSVPRRPSPARTFSCA